MHSSRIRITLAKIAIILSAFLLALTPLAWSRDNETILYSFAGPPDGSFPFEGSLTVDSNGNLYGTTSYGGTYGNGTVFRLTPNAGGGWTETILYSFTGGLDGGQPEGRLIFDSNGNLYGTTEYIGVIYPGVAFELSPSGGGSWTESTLYQFSGGDDGGYPSGGLVMDGKGNLYGLTKDGGTFNAGTIFELSPKAGGGWTEAVLHNFSGADGSDPRSELVPNQSGGFYGTTAVGGAYGYGTVFELAPAGGGGWTETVLHSFNEIDGDAPLAGLIMDQAGSLYGTTENGRRWSILAQPSS